MPDEKPDNYDLEPSEPESAAEKPGASRPWPVGIPRPSEVEPLPIEPDDLHESKKSVKDLDVCPNCGASMRGSDDLVCIRCGFDLKTNKQVRTVTGTTTPAGDESNPESDEEREILIKTGNGDLWLPGIIAGLCFLVLLIGYLSGVSSLFPMISSETAGTHHPAEIGFGMRIEAIVRLIVLVGMLAACGMGALWFIAQIQGMRLARTVDELKLGAVRMLAIACAMRLAAFIALPYQILELSVEAVIQLAVFAGLSLALFRLTPRDAPTLVLSAMVLFVGLWVVAHAVIWATG